MAEGAPAAASMLAAALGSGPNLVTGGADFAGASEASKGTAGGGFAAMTRFDCTGSAGGTRDAGTEGATLTTGAAGAAGAGVTGATDAVVGVLSGATVGICGALFPRWDAGFAD